MGATTPTHVPAAVVATGNGMPSCCAKHGQPATLAKKLQLMSRPPSWAYVLLLAGALPYLIVVMILRKTVTAPAWPFCDECAAARKKTMSIGLGLLAVGLLSIIVLIVVAPNGGATGLFFLLGFVLALAGLLVSVRGGWRFQSTAEVTSDGTHVLVRQAHPQFAQLVPSTMAGA